MTIPQMLNQLQLLRAYILLLFLFLGCTPVQQQETGSTQESPNIIIILADDMGYSDLGCYGSEINTPNIDRLAQGGLRFRTFYNDAKCCPTRAALLTGLHHHEAGMGGMVDQSTDELTQGPYQGYLSQETVTIAEALQLAGYKTYMSGKWHVGERPQHWPRKRGFDRYFGLISGASSYYEIIKDQPRNRQMAYDDDTWEPPTEGFFMTDAFSDTACAFVQKHLETEGENPFFLALTYTAPHWPLHAHPEDIAKYQGRYMIGWDSLRQERYQRQLNMGLLDESFPLSPRSPDIPSWEEVENKEDWAHRMAVYAAMIDRMDQGIGKLLQTLEAQEALENTLIFFLADNGGCHENIEGRNLHDPEVPIGARGSYMAYREPWANASNTPFRYYKSWSHEGGTRTPLIVHWPAGIQEKAHIIAGQSGHITDLMPTCLEVAGADYPSTFEGRTIKPLVGKSLLPIFRLEDLQRTSPFFFEFGGNKAVIQKEWKLVAAKKSDWELYNLESDPTELENLAEAMPEKVQEMKQLYQAWANKVGVRQR